MTTATWIALDFRIRPLDPGDFLSRRAWSRYGGVYIFAQGLDDGRWKPIYVGITNSFRDRLPYHLRWWDASREGATHIHTRLESSAYLRKTQERTLIYVHDPILNIHHRLYLGPASRPTFAPARIVPSFGLSKG